MKFNVDRPQILKILYLLTAAGLLFYFFQVWHYDDPYITYRYAANLAEGNGFVYNLDTRILSTTSPLFALLLGAAGKLGADIPGTAVLFGAVSIAVGGLLLWEIGSALDRPGAALAGALLYPTSSLLVGTIGSETPLYLALCLAAILLYLRERYVPAGILLAFAVFMRGDALVLAALLGLDWLLNAAMAGRSASRVLREVPYKALLGFLAVLLPWVLFSISYFGSPLPVTLAAKQAQGALTPTSLFLPGLWDLVVSLAQTPHNWILWAAALVGLRTAALTDNRWMVLVLWPFLFVIGYTTLDVSRYPWYYASLVPGLAAAAALGLSALRRKVDPEQSGDRKTTWRRAAPALLLILILGGQISDLLLLGSNLDKRYDIYRDVGLWLADNTPPDSTVGTLEVGIIGYYVRPRTMIDFAGLLQPEVAAQFQEGYDYAQSAAWTVEHFQPDVVVLRVEANQELIASYVAVRCIQGAYFVGDAYDFWTDLVIYIC